MSNPVIHSIYLLIILLLVVMLFLKQIDDFFGGLISKFFETLPKFLPWLFQGKAWLSKRWLQLEQRFVISKELKKVTGISVPVEIQFVQAKKARTQKQGHKFIVMYNPSENHDENFANIVLTVAENLIPNAKKLMNPQLQKCVRLALALDLVESYSGPHKARDFTTTHLLKGDINHLTSNPCYAQIGPMKDKRLFSRLYVHTLSVFGSQFDMKLDSPQLKSTADKITLKISELAKSFMEIKVPHLIKPSEPGYEDGYEYFFRENGLAINIMFVRSFTNFSREDISKYVNKCKALLEKGMNVNYLVGGGFSTKNIGSKDFQKRVDFAKRVAKELKKLPALDLVSESEQPFVQFGVEYPIYIAIFVRK